MSAHRISSHEVFNRTMAARRAKDAKFSECDAAQAIADYVAQGKVETIAPSPKPSRRLVSLRDLTRP